MTQKPHLHIVVTTVMLLNDFNNHVKNKDLFIKLLFFTNDQFSSGGVGIGLTYRSRQTGSGKFSHLKFT